MNKNIMIVIVNKEILIRYKNEFSQIPISIIYFDWLLSFFSKIIKIKDIIYIIKDNSEQILKIIFNPIVMFGYYIKNSFYICFFPFFFKLTFSFDYIHSHLFQIAVLHCQVKRRSFFVKYRVSNVHH